MVKKTKGFFFFEKNVLDGIWVGTIETMRNDPIRRRS